MKHIIMALVAVVALVGCGKSSDEKAVDTINSDSDTAVALYNQASTEYSEGYSIIQNLKYESSSALPGRLDEARAKYVAARDHFRQSRQKMQHILDVKDDHDNVKLIGEDSLRQDMERAEKNAANAQSTIDKIDEIKAKL